MPSSIELVTGLGGAVGCDLRPAKNQLIFVEFAGKLSALNLIPTATIVSQGTAVLKGTWLFDLDTGTESGLTSNVDIFWEQVTSTVRQMTPENGATLLNLGVTDFNSISAANLQGLPYSNVPIDGNNDATNLLVTNDVFAVLTNKGNYAKVQVLSYGYNLTIRWVTYHLDSGYTVLGTGYNQPEDVKMSVDGIHAYVTERSGDLVKVDLGSANRASATVVASGMTAPQQLFLDEAHNAVYVVEYTAPGKLWKIDIPSGTKTAIVSNLDHPVGLVLSADLQYAYISEQTTGPDKGRVSSIQISSATRTSLLTGMTNPFYLTWADATQDALLVPQRDPSNSIVSINIITNASLLIASGVPFRPSSVAIPGPGQMLICSDSVIEAIDFVSGTLQPGGPLLIGIGFIPFDRVTIAGLGDTSVDPTYFYQVKGTPFGGTLPLMVNHLRAGNDGASYYQVFVDGTVRTDTWTDYLWNGTDYVLQTIAPISIGVLNGLYPVRPLSELFLWANPSLGDLVDSTNLSNGLHVIEIQFVNAIGTYIESSTPLTILVNNQHCVAVLTAPTLQPGGTVADACGVLHYGSITTPSTVIMGLIASHPANFATFSFALVRGVTGVTLPAVPPTSGPVSTAVSPITDTVAALLGTCPVAGFAEDLYVAATINSGWSRQSQYDAQALIAFVLAP